MHFFLWNNFICIFLDKIIFNLFFLFFLIDFNSVKNIYSLVKWILPLTNGNHSLTLRITRDGLYFVKR